MAAFCMSVVPSHGAGAWCAPAGGDAPLAGARVGPSPAAGPTRDSRRPMTTANTAKQPTQSAHRASNLFKRVWFDLANSYPNTPVRRGAVASARRASGLAGASFPPASRVHTDMPGRARSAPPPSGSAGSAPPPHARRRPPRREYILLIIIIVIHQFAKVARLCDTRNIGQGVQRCITCPSSAAQIKDGHLS